MSNNFAFAEQSPHTESPLPDMTAAYRKFIAAYSDNPVAFVENVLKAKPLPWQKDFLNAIAKGERRISVRAGHGVGKSTVCAWAMVWHMLMRAPQKTICTAPTSSQLMDALFAEVKRWINQLPDFLKELFNVLSDRITLIAAPESSFISARTSSRERPEALAGVHSENVLIICDEASGIPEEVFQAAVGSMSGHNACTILIGNPTRNVGLFFKTHHGLKHDWFTMKVSCVDIPLVAKDFLLQVAQTYGVQSNAYRVRVLGEFALADDDALISAETVDSAMCRDIEIDPQAPLIYGLDVARYGSDRTVLCKRQGNVVYPLQVLAGRDLMETVGFIMNEIECDMDLLKKPTQINIDSIGLGAGVADRLRETCVRYNIDIRDVNVSESSAMNIKASRLRDELWMAVRDWLAARACKLEKDDTLRAELCAPTYTFDSQGRLKVESKDMLKSRGQRSPDLADSLALTFAGVGAYVGGRAYKMSNAPLSRGIRGIV